MYGVLDERLTKFKIYAIYAFIIAAYMACCMPVDICILNVSMPQCAANSNSILIHNSTWLAWVICVVAYHNMQALYLGKLIFGGCQKKCVFRSTMRQLA